MPQGTLTYGTLQGHQIVTVGRQFNCYFSNVEEIIFENLV